MRIQYERPDGTLGSIDGGSIESLRLAKSKIIATGGRVVWASDPAIMVDPLADQPTPVTNASRNDAELMQMPSSVPCTNATEPGPRQGPCTVSEMVANGGEVRNTSGKELRDYEMLPYMPTMNFEPPAPKNNGKRQGSNQSHEADSMAMPAMQF